MLRLIPRQSLTPVILALGVLLGIAACNPAPAPFRGTAVEQVSWGSDFSLTAQNGERFDSASLRGKVQVIFFGYTHCPDICAPTLVKLVQARQQLGPDAARLQVLFITVDPAHDTPQQLKTFLAGFDSTFIGLTGTLDEVQAVAAGHKSYFKSEGKDGKRVTHTGMLYLKDSNGRVRVLVREDSSVEDLVHDLRLLIRQ